MLITVDHIDKVDLYNFKGIKGAYSTYEIQSNSILKEAVWWALGEQRILHNTLFYLTQSSFIAVKVTINNSNLFYHNRDKMVVEKRLYRNKKIEITIDNIGCREKDVRGIIRVPYYSASLLKDQQQIELLRRNV